MTVTGPLLLLLCVTGSLTAAVLPEDRDVGIDISINVDKDGRVTTSTNQKRSGGRHRGPLLDQDQGEAAGPLGGEEDCTNREPDRCAAMNDVDCVEAGPGAMIDGMDQLEWMDTNCALKCRKRYNSNYRYGITSKCGGRTCGTCW